MIAMKVFMDSLQYLLLCLAFGGLLPWFVFWWGHIIAFFFGYIINPFILENRIKKATNFIKLYLFLTPVVFTLIGAVDFAMSRVYSSGSGIGGLPFSSGFALAHAFVMWVIISFAFGGVVRGRRELNKINQQFAPQPKNDGTFNQ